MTGRSCHSVRYTHSHTHTYVVQHHSERLQAVVTHTRTQHHPGSIHSLTHAHVVQHHPERLQAVVRSLADKAAVAFSAYNNEAPVLMLIGHTLFTLFFHELQVQTLTRSSPTCSPALLTLLSFHQLHAPHALPKSTCPSPKGMCRGPPQEHVSLPQEH